MTKRNETTSKRVGINAGGGEVMVTRNQVIVDHPLRLKYKLIHGEVKGWTGEMIKTGNGCYSTAGCGFVPTGKTEYVYE